MRDYEPYYTEDGSIGLYSYAEKDVFHSKYGALTEAWEKFILPAEKELGEIKNLKVLDICYGIGYNTKALMSFLINKSEKQNKNFIKKILKKIFTNITNIVSIDTNKNKKIKEEILSNPTDTIHTDNNFSCLIDCLDINEELIKLSPFFKTVKTAGEIYDDIVPQIFTCFDSYYTMRNLFENITSFLNPKNKKDIQELLDLKFKYMHIDKEYKINPYVNYIILNKLYEKYEKNYYTSELKKNLTKKNFRRYFSKSLVRYARFNHFWGYKTSSEGVLSAFLHNIYYSHLSKRYKKVDFKTADAMFKLNFSVDDARKTILTLNQQYDLIFLDAFTYTRAPQLWSAEFIAELYKRLSPTGLLMTYSTSAQVRNTLIENNFFVGKIINSKTKKVIGTIASKDKSKIEYPLSNYELGLCATKAGIPYHDPNLNLSGKEILELREYDFKHSKLMSSSKYIKIRGLQND